MTIEAQAKQRYNKIMFELGNEHKTIETEFSQNTETWGIAEMVKECKYQLDLHLSDGTNYNDMKYDDDPEIRKQYKSEVGKLTRFIKKYQDCILK